MKGLMKMLLQIVKILLSVIKSPPDWEVGVYAAGALALLGIAAVSLWTPEKDLESPSSTRLEDGFPYHDSRALTRSPSPCAWTPDTCQCRRCSFNPWVGKIPGDVVA